MFNLIKKTTKSKRRITVKVTARITALALACAMTVGGFIHMASTDPISVQNHNAIIMEAEAATDFDLAYPKFGSYYTKKDSGIYWIHIDVENGYNYKLGIPNRRFKVFIDGKELTSTSDNVTIDDYTFRGYTRSNGWYITGNLRHIKGWFKVSGAKGTTHRIVFKFANGSSRGITFILGK